MMTPTFSGNGQKPPILEGCTVLPPMNPTPPANRPPVGKTADRDRGKAKRKSAERFVVLNDFVDFTLAGLSRAEIAVWLVLYRDTRNGVADTAYDDLARRAGLNRRNVGRALRRLELRGLLQVVRRGGLNRGPSRYRILSLAKDG